MSKRRKQDGWALWSERAHRLIAVTFAPSQDECWGHAYDWLSGKHPEWGRKYWKRWNPSTKAAAEMGYRLVRVNLVLA